MEKLFKIELDTVDELKQEDFNSGIYNPINLEVLKSEPHKNGPLAFDTVLKGSKKDIMLFLENFYDEDETFFNKYAKEI